jgi:hypothetical protein
MSETEPAIIQGGHPFKVEAVLSKTGGVNALAKHAPDLQKGQDLGSDRREALPSEGALNDHRVQLDASLADLNALAGPLRQDQFDSQHREQFVDPSRRLTTRRRVKIQESEDANSSTDSPSAEADQGTEKNSIRAQARKASSALAAETQHDREQFHRRIEQIKNNNESVGKDLAALEKSTPQRGGLKPAE